MSVVSPEALARQYTLTPIPIGDYDQVLPADVNSAGQVTGSLVREGSGLEARHGFVWSSAGGLVDLGAGRLPNAIGDGGAVVGRTVGAGDFIWTAAQGVRPLSSRPGGAPFSSSSTIAYDVNASGQVLGLTTDAQYRAFIFNPDGTVRKLPLPAEADGLPLADVQVISLTNAGDAVGWLYFYKGDNYTFHGAVWPSAGGVRLLDDLPGGQLWSQANHINSHGVISGIGMSASGQRPIVWTPDGRIIDLGDLPGRTWGSAETTNDLGEAVGFSAFFDPETSSQSFRAFLWTGSEGMLDLNDLVDGSGAGWTLSTGQAINNAGQILVGGYFDGRYRAALLTPLVPEPSALALFSIAAAAMLRRPATGRYTARSRQHPVEALPLRRTGAPG